MEGNNFTVQHLCRMDISRLFPFLIENRWVNSDTGKWIKAGAGNKKTFVWLITARLPPQPC
jgi:hypothetical protein